MKDFREEKSAKTPSFFSLLDFCGISNKQKESLVKMGDEMKETVRYCLHKNVGDSLHVMLIYHPYKKEIGEQIFNHTDSYYFLLDGAFKLINLQDKSEIIFDFKTYFIGKIGKNIPYKMEIMSDKLLFIEVRERNTKG